MKAIVMNSYGGPDGLKELVDAAHQRGISVILDVVYNHLGPEGNYLRDFGPYFTDKYKAPWGEALNFDGVYSDGVRNFFIENAIYWFREYHIDALRIDAIHGIFDLSATPFLEELAGEIEQYSKEKGRKLYLIAESDLNDARIIRPRNLGGYGIDAQWNDDYHHCVHALLTGESNGYYQDFGKIEHLIKALEEGFVYSWKYSTYRQRHHGNSSKDRDAYRIEESRIDISFVHRMASPFRWRLDAIHLDLHVLPAELVRVNAVGNPHALNTRYLLHAIQHPLHEDSGGFR